MNKIERFAHGLQRTVYYIFQYKSNQQLFKMADMGLCFKLVLKKQIGFKIKDIGTSTVLIDRLALYRD